MAKAITPDDSEELIAAVVGWFQKSARDLPWRRPEADGWAVLVSEVMLQQTPVSRVLPVWEAWLERWPSPSDLASEPSSAAVAAWGRLGYPRRALRLHQAATVIAREHDDVVPHDHAQLLALPGVGEYTAAAVASFAYGQAHPVLDTNVRRVLARALNGRAYPPASLNNEERTQAQALTDAAGDQAAHWAAAAMELGALVCTAKNPACALCPIAARCEWLALGKPENAQPGRAQAWHGTDRQCRGHLLEQLRNQDRVEVEVLIGSWHDQAQSRRCVESLVADGLARLDETGQTISL